MAIINPAETRFKICKTLKLKYFKSLIKNKIYL